MTIVRAVTLQETLGLKEAPSNNVTGVITGGQLLHINPWCVPFSVFGVHVEPKKQALCA